MFKPRLVRGAHSRVHACVTAGDCISLNGRLCSVCSLMSSRVDLARASHVAVSRPPLSGRSGVYEIACGLAASERGNDSCRHAICASSAAEIRRKEFIVVQNMADGQFDPLRRRMCGFVAVLVA
jgi:hypothetical protein